MSSQSPKPQGLSPRVYWLTRAVHALAPLLTEVSKLETLAVRERVSDIAVDRPIYICGVPRSGTTISLEMFSQHPSVATHRYSDFSLPFLPVWAPHITSLLGLPRMSSPVERSHRDRVMITSDSPECVEEMFWERYFDNLHDEARCNVLDAETSNPAFEAFYRDHIRKLLAVRGGARYLTKSNCCVLRLRYLLRVFPDVRILLYIRNPIDHVASIVKQDRLFGILGRKNPRRALMSRLHGHHHFGSARIFNHLGDAEHVAQVRRLAEAGRSPVAWALQWAATYGYVADQLEADPALAAVTKIVRYEDLCADPRPTIDGILAHAELDGGAFQAVRDQYANKLSLPDYYKPEFEARDLADVIEATQETARRFGYEDLSDAANRAVA
ncbi:sulfotransferase [Haliangium sp.]|uniref:sulfotransferase n=1 Tax=Haliangium sp. TaxID=2663208 RepID=UPI003D139FA4